MIFSTATLRLGSVFRYGYVASVCVMLPFSLFFGVSALFGGSGVYSNGRPVFGIGALVISIVIGFLAPLMGAIVLTLGTLVMRLIKDVAPTLETREG